MKKLTYPLFLGLVVFAFGLPLLFVLHQFFLPSTSAVILILTLAVVVGIAAALRNPFRK